MKVFGRYLQYRLKQSTLRTIVFTVLSVMVCLIMTSEVSSSTRNEQYRATGIYMLAAILGIICTLIPILELSVFKTRRNLDTLFFFPIKRTKMALAHYLSGAIQIFTVYTVSFVSVWIYLLATTDCFRLGYMPLYYLFSLLLGWVMYSIFTFLFSEGNTVPDGILFCALWAFVAYLVMYVFHSVSRAVLDRQVLLELESLSGWGIIYAPINNLTVIFQDLIEVNRASDAGASYYVNYADRYMAQMYMFFVWGAVGIAAAFGFFFNFKRKGAHLAGEISDSPFGYKLLIPVYGYGLLLLSDGLEIMSVIIFALMLVGYFIYRRGFKIKTRDIIFIACGIIPLIISGVLR
ncbi:MAG: hypothetical protein ACI3X1_01160 [Eubacteriales bacterium]